MAARKKKKRIKLDSKIDKKLLKENLLLKQKEVREDFIQKYPEAHKYLKEKGVELEKAREHSAKIIGAGALTGSLLVSPPSGVKALPAPQEIIDRVMLSGGSFEAGKVQKLLVDNLNQILPAKPRPLSRNEEKLLEQVFENLIGVKTRATLEGEHLNTTYGYIGAEQHLKRYPGDTLESHGEGNILKSGIAPGLGAWGYFSPSRYLMTNELEETEKWYAVVQTLYLHDWNTRQPYLRDWYKHRKVMIVNTQNGNAIIAAIADSGPAAWTGKHFGGSPEVMHYLGGSRYKKGPVILFFVDDPENKVPLGPVEYNKIDLEGVKTSKA